MPSGRTECNVTGELTLQTKSRYKRIQLYRTDVQELSAPIRIKLKKLVSGQIVYF